MNTTDEGYIADGLVYMFDTTEMNNRQSSDNTMLVPCKMDIADKNPKGFKMSVVGGFEVENNPFRINTILFIGSKKRFRNHLKSKIGIDIFENAKYDFEDVFSGVSGLTFPCNDADGVGYVAIWMPRFGWSVTDIETLSHECLHAAVMVMRMSGIKAKIFSPKNDEGVDDEGLAYAQSQMLAALLKELARKQQKSYHKLLAAV